MLYRIVNAAFGVLVAVSWCLVGAELIARVLNG